MIFMQIFSHTTKGFTLIESIVSITLLSIAVVGPMTLAARSLKDAGAARSEMIATHLAEEGLEIVHSLRDNNSADDSSDRVGINGRKWMTQNMDIYKDNCRIRSCVLDITAHVNPNVWTGAAVNLCPVNCVALSIVYFNPETGLYRQSGSALGSPWIPTQFHRTITMVGIDDNVWPVRQVRVTATVTYPGYGGNTQTVSISEDLYNWFPEL